MPSLRTELKSAMWTWSPEAASVPWTWVRPDVTTAPEAFSRRQLTGFVAALTIDAFFGPWTA